ncbi:unnamed protein product, partial [Brenthis ino]
MLQYILVLLVIVLVVSAQRIKSKKLPKLHEEIKTQFSYIPFIGHAHHFFGSSEDRMNRLKELAYQAYKNKHGIVNVWLGNTLYYGISDPEAAKLLLKSYLDKGPLSRLAHHLIGDGSIFSSVDTWRHRRRILCHATASKHTNNFMEIFERNSNVLVQQLARVAGKGDVSCFDFVYSCSLNSSCETEFGECVQENSEHTFRQAFIEYYNNLSVRPFQFWLHNDAVYRWMPVYRKQVKARNIIHDFVTKLIQRRKNALKSTHQENHKLIYFDAKGNNKTESYTELLMKYSGGDKGYSDTELLEESLMMLMASTDTSTIAICFTLILLSQYRDVQEKIYKEIHSVVGDSGRITLNDINKLEYLDAVIKESLRLYPPVPVIIRYSDKDFELPSGLQVCKGDHLVIHIWGIHRNPQYWGKDAEEFQPERFLNVTPQQLYAFIPFSYGTRNCAGVRHAMIFLKTTLANIIHKYHIEPPTSYECENPLRVKFVVTMKHVHDYKLQMRSRV